MVYYIIVPDRRISSLVITRNCIPCWSINLSEYFPLRNNNLFSSLLVVDHVSQAQMTIGLIQQVHSFSLIFHDTLELSILFIAKYARQATFTLNHIQLCILFLLLIFTPKYMKFSTRSNTKCCDVTKYFALVSLTTIIIIIIILLLK